MAVDVLLGLQWGDEGKGKIVDCLAKNYDMIARFQGGPNAGHTLKFDNQEFVLHTIPSGIFHDNIINLVGNGVVIDPVGFQEEIDKLKALNIDVSDKLFISKKAHLILPTHRILDAASESSKGKEKIGSTLKGIGPTYMDKTGRNGLRVGDILTDDFKERYNRLKEKHQHLIDTYNYKYDLTGLEEAFFSGIETLKSLNIVEGEYLINQYIKEGKNILAEGAQGSMLDINFGTYPFVTSSSTITASVCIGLGISPQSINEVIGIAKAYCTRVGSGPFPSELEDATGEQLRKVGHEFGATTGRPRRCGWIDLPALKYTIMLNGVTQLAITKIDVLNGFKEFEVTEMYEYDGIQTENVPYDLNRDDIKMINKKFTGWNSSTDNIKNYDELPEKLVEYLAYLEEKLEVKITMISTGPGREELVNKLSPSMAN